MMGGNAAIQDCLHRVRCGAWSASRAGKGMTVIT